MSRTSQAIADLKVPNGALGIFWLAQAGYAFKTSSGQIVYVDPYLSDCVERLAGFKRLMVSPIAAHDVEADFVVSTHEHPDHLDVDALPELAANPRTRFVGSEQCVEEYRRIGLTPDRYSQIGVGSELSLGSTRLTALYADHGEYAKDAVGIVFDFAGIRLYHTGDTAYRPEQMRRAAELRPEIIIPCINGAFGNLDARDAARLSADVGAGIAIPSHYWMFAEQNGNPGDFVEACGELAPRVRPVIISPGEPYLYVQAARELRRL